MLNAVTMATFIWIVMRSKLYLLGGILLLLTSCSPVSMELEPTVVYTPPKQWYEILPSAFPPLTPEEKRQEWSKEWRLGMGFIKEMDFYRAITCFKRAKFMLPTVNIARRQQIEFNIIEAYYLGEKYKETIEVYEQGSLNGIGTDFPAYKELLIILVDSYRELNKCDKSLFYHQQLEQLNLQVSENLKLSQALKEGDIDCVEQRPHSSSIDEFLACYRVESLSVSKAQTLNALLPGAGYLYVGQSKTALTSFIINTLFIAAAVQFFERGYTALGVITASLEGGWYFGGINGAGLAAKEYNERLYENRVKDYMVKERLFPVLMFEFVF